MDQPQSERGPERRVSVLDRLNAAALLSITPEYRSIKRLQTDGFGDKPTFSRPAEMPLEYRTVAGIRVRLAHSKSDGPSVILLNPLPQSIVAFAPIWSALASEFDLYAYDLPGFGRSDGGVEQMTFEAQGRFLRDFIDELGIRSPHLIGPDVGMAAALHYVTHFENEVESLMVGDGPAVEPSANGSIIDKTVNSAFWRLVFKVAGAGSFVHAANQLCYVNYTPSPGEVSDYIESYSGRIGAVTEWFRKYPESLASIDPHLGEIQQPVLIFWGDEDQLLYPENAERLGRRLQRSRLHVFERCGHFSYQDRYEEFADLATEWVQGGYRQA